MYITVILVILKIYVLHGSVVTQLKCCRIFGNHFIANVHGIQQ